MLGSSHAMWRNRWKAMSVLAVVVGQDARSRVTRMLDASHRVGDGVPTLACDGDIVVGIRLGASSGSITVESDLIVAVDGWIDGVRGVDRVGDSGPDQPTSGATAVASAYRSFGQGLFARLRGDFVVVIVDRQSSELVLGRDRAGAKPCFISQRSGQLCAASQVAMVRVDPMVSSEPDEAVIAEHLSGSFANPIGTVLRDVERLGAASSLVAHRGRIRTQRYWNPDDLLEDAHRQAAEPQSVSTDDLLVHLATARSLLDTAVERRIGTDPIALELSGGLDSSSVVGTAATRSSGTCGGPLTTASLRMPGGGHGDEWTHIDAVHRAWSLDSIVVPPTSSTRSALEEYVRATGYLPASPNGFMWTDLKRRLAANGFKTTLSGTGGDEWFARSRLWPVQRLETRDLTSVRHLVRSQRRHSIGALVNMILRPAVHEVAMWQRRVPGWISPALASRTGLADRLITMLPAEHRRSPSADRARTAKSTWGSLSFEGSDRHGSFFGMETRHPLWDEDLVEFALRLPEAYRWQDAHPRGFQAAAFGDRLPASVAVRRDKAHFGDLSIEAIDALGGWRTIETGACVRNGWVESVALEQVYRRLRATYDRTGYTPGLKPLWNLMAIDLWLGTT